MTEDKMFRMLERSLPREPPPQTYTAAHFHAALHVAAAVKGFLVRAARTTGLRGCCMGHDGRGMSAVALFAHVRLFSWQA